MLENVQYYLIVLPRCQCDGIRHLLSMCNYMWKRVLIVCGLFVD